MSEKIYVRKIETWTISSASEPIEVNVEALRKCEPPYKGDSEQELVNYLQNEVWNEYEFYDNEHNKEVYGEDELQNLLLEDGYHDKKVYSDSREKGCEDWVELGHLNEEYRKTGGFESLKDNGNW